MISKFNAKLLCVAMIIGCFNLVFSQDSISKSERVITRKFTFLEFRGTNAIDIAAGSLQMEGDYPEYEYDIYFRIGYKRQLTSHLNANVTFNKYNVSIKDVSNEGFMSFDLNLEYLFSPYTKFSPFLFAGGGYNAANYFESTATKVQAGLGFELIVAPHIGLKLFGEYNYLFSDDIDGLIEGDTDDALIRMGLGFNFYFGGKKKKEMYQRKLKTVINSNQIIPYN
ncbi:outer membrane beta-barrel protein [uncultured Winogradskyella sp.]|uniref:outer membrane protein n=1 Tax=uncultured Winogradskyella sp. TaxID=395353 RepID=UPI002633018F|nr:outer membrane beta-barrel protein [uncultured Winogradskyella sp.]|tara:strand:+ start:470 stop:1144 length:675 start_codon:yes stop_codon:yes gene_type:complete